MKIWLLRSMAEEPLYNIFVITSVACESKRDCLYRLTKICFLNTLAMD